MPSITWMQRAVASSAAVRSLELWRAVEAQHKVTTQRLTTSLADQHLLEDILEAGKPPLAAGTEHLDYLLATPFRYPSPDGSRFRAPSDPGVWYGAVDKDAALAECGYWRWRFARAGGLTEIPATAQTVFAAGVRDVAIDLTKLPFKRHRGVWTAPDDYGQTQSLRRVVDTAGHEQIVYESVRDPNHGTCSAVLRPTAFVRRSPQARETWNLTVLAERIVWERDGATREFLSGRRAWQA